MNSSLSLLGVCLLGFALPAWAGNGLNLIAPGGEAEMMAGADVAVARDSTALSTNPAGLVQIANQRLDITTDIYYYSDISHQDSIGNDKRSMPRVGAIGGGAYARRLSPDLVVGAGLFVQGGLGFGYEDFDSGLGASGDMNAIFSILKLAPGAAWKFNDQLAVGVSLNLLYASARQKFFPAASIHNAETPEASFYGNRLDGLQALTANYKLGVRYQPTRAVSLGLSFSPRTPLKLKGGELKMNYEALGRGRVTYESARLDGLALAQDVSLGIAVQANRRLLLSAELTWIDWSEAIGELSVVATRPAVGADSQQVPARVVQPSRLDYRDQYVIALGFSYELDERNRLRGGYNYGRAQTPEQNLNPLFAAIAEQHFIVGWAHDLNPKWELGLGAQLQPHRKVRYQNPSAPFTVDAQENNEVFYLLTSIARRW